MSYVMYVKSERRVSNGDIPVKAESQYNQKVYKIISSLSYSFSLNLFRFKNKTNKEHYTEATWNRTILERDNTHSTHTLLLTFLT